MKTIKLIFAALLIAGGGLFYSSCQKDNMTLNPQSGISNSDLKAAPDEAFLDQQSAFVDGVVQAVTFEHSDVKAIYGLPGCATVTYDTLAAVKSATVNFGTIPCLTNHEENQYRQGILLITWTGNMADPGTVKTVTTQDYAVGDAPGSMHQFSFTRTITNMGLDAAGNLHFAIVMTNAVLTLDSGQTITWNANHDREWVQQSPSNTNDDFFLITGSSSGTDRNGLSFTSQITTPLKKTMSCEWIVSGTKVVTHGDNPDKTIDFGD